MRLPRRSPAAAALLTLALALGACGDALSEDELRTQATAICVRATAATDRIAVPARPSEGGTFLAEGVAELRAAVRRLQALKAPDELRERYDRAVELAAEEVALIARHERAVTESDDVIATFRRLDAELEPLIRQQDAYWRGLQIPACVRR